MKALHVLHDIFVNFFVNIRCIFQLASCGGCDYTDADNFIQYNNSTGGGWEANCCIIPELTSLGDNIASAGTPCLAHNTYIMVFSTTWLKQENNKNNAAHITSMEGDGHK